jgi:hypothetical protein
MFKIISINGKKQTGFDKPCNFNFNGERFYFGGICSSRVENITVYNDLSMVVETKNSVYFFKKVNL